MYSKRFFASIKDGELFSDFAEFSFADKLFIFASYKVCNANF